MKIERKWQVFIIVTVLNIVADQATKIWARASLELDSRGYGIPQPVIEGIWEWRLSFNKGSAFGLFHGIGGARVFLTLIGIGALIAVFFMVKGARKDQTKLVHGLGLVAGGAIGNLIDRIAMGKVTDFVVWKYYDSFEWPTFNVADVSLVVGVGYLLLDMRTERIREKAEKAAKEAEEKAARKKTKKKRPGGGKSGGSRKPKSKKKVTRSRSAVIL